MCFRSHSDSFAHLVHLSNQGFALVELSCFFSRWQRELAVTHLKRMSPLRGKVDVKKRTSADQVAFDTGFNTLNITSRLMPTYKDFRLLRVAKPTECE